MADIWPVVDAERATLSSELAALGDDGWATRSLCSDWTVRDVVAT